MDKEKIITKIERVLWLDKIYFLSACTSGLNQEELDEETKRLNHGSAIKIFNVFMKGIDK